MEPYVELEVLVVVVVEVVVVDWVEVLVVVGSRLVVLAVVARYRRWNCHEPSRELQEPES